MATYTLDLCTGGTPTSDTGTAASAFDDNESTHCDTANDNNEHWIMYQFAVAKAICKVRLAVAQYYGLDVFKIQGSQNGSGFTDLSTGLAAISASGTEWKEFTFANTTPYLYIRLYCGANDAEYSGGAISWYECEMMALKSSNGFFIFL